MMEKAKKDKTESDKKKNEVKQEQTDGLSLNGKRSSVVSKPINICLYMLRKFKTNILLLYQ